MQQDAVDSDVRVAVAFDVSPEAAEVLADRLFDAGASAVAELPRDDELVTLVADLDPAGLERLTDERRADVAPGELVTPGPRVLEPDAAWNGGWREFAVAWLCGDRVVLRPEWVHHEPQQWSGEIVVGDAADGSDPVGRSASPAAPTTPIEILIEPGNAFGSGSHVTTRLCVERLALSALDGHRVLDVGCGTGVLGVVAALMGADSVTAIDIDPEAVRVTRLVAERNGAADRVQASGTPLDEVVGSFDMVLANLLVPIIEHVGAQLASRVGPGGRLVASGILAEQQSRVSAALAPLELEGVTAADGWVAMVFRRPRVG